MSTYTYPYVYPVTTYKPVSGPETFNFMIGMSPDQCTDVLFMGTFDDRFHVVVHEKDGVIKPLPDYEDPDYNPYRILVSTNKGLNDMGIEDDIIFRIDGLY